MKLPLLLIPLLFFMTSCTIDWNDEKDKKIAELEKQVTELKEKKDDEFFKKKQECTSYRDKIMEDINDPKYTRYKLDPELNEIFYSPTRKSCIYVYATYPMESCTNWDYDSIETLEDFGKLRQDFIKYCTKEINITDFLTKEIIFIENMNQREQGNECFDRISKTEEQNYDVCNRFEASYKIQELKGE